MFFKKEKKKATAEKPVHCNELAKFSIWMKCPLEVILSAIKKKKKSLAFSISRKKGAPLDTGFTALSLSSGAISPPPV